LKFGFVQCFPIFVEKNKTGKQVSLFTCFFEKSVFGEAR